MGQTDLGKYKGIYLQTAKEYIEKIIASLNRLSEDTFNKNALNDLHISSHSLRSQSQVVGLAEIANACLDIEKNSDNALKSNASLGEQEILHMKTAAESLRETLKRMGNEDANL